MLAEILKKSFDKYFNTSDEARTELQKIIIKGRFTADLQYRLFIGKSELPNNVQREGISNMFIIGLNWYQI